MNNERNFNNNVLSEKSLGFSIKVVETIKRIMNDQKEFILTKQVLRSGTAIGALIREANFAESRKDFAHKLHIALKEANETEYWLILLNKTRFLVDEEFETLRSDVVELIKILTSSIKTVKSRLK